MECVRPMDSEDISLPSTACFQPNAPSEPPRQTHLDPSCVDGKLAFCLDGVFTLEECQQLIAATERQGYDAALLNMGGGDQVLARGIRNGSRKIVDDEQLAQLMFDRTARFLPQLFSGRPLVGLNERLRFLKYEPGEYFIQHQDGTFVREGGPQKGERSYLTLLLYLNEDYIGGATTFASFTGDHTVAVTPRTGMVIVHQHDILHESPVLRTGVKYVIRTDVMYSGVVQAGTKFCGDCGGSFNAEDMVQKGCGLKCRTCASDWD
eukprot:TRINITY_DN16015_c0_g1_i1.p1 TRINITY_DN16015_c0_g1~~TRINITY_DN16015_c0_g1_i1.p1  ORF type:complete len:264 (-),score=28.83 TRINITY_DN16015_c0_g1_i1:217-1008(-)